MQTIKEYHYVYKITNNKPIDERKYYIGVRTAKGCTPQEDVKYMSSSKYLKESIRELGLENFSKEILSIWDSRELANAEESRLHKKYKVASDTEYYNLFEALTNGFNVSGRVTVLDTRDNKTKLVSKEDFENCEYYQSPSVGTLTVTDTRDGTIKRVTVDEYNNSDFFTTAAKNKVAVLDTRDNTKKYVTKEEYRNNDFYKSHASETVLVLDISDGTSKRVLREEYEMCDYYQSPINDKVAVIDTRDNVGKFVTKDDYEKYDYYVSCSTGKMAVLDTRDNTGKYVTLEEYHSNEFYVSPRSITTKIFNNLNELVYIVTGNFEKFCKNHNLPHSALNKSRKNGGSRIYENLDKKDAYSTFN